MAIGVLVKRMTMPSGSRPACPAGRWGVSPRPLWFTETVTKRWKGYWGVKTVRPQAMKLMLRKPCCVLP